MRPVGCLLVAVLLGLVTVLVAWTGYELYLDHQLRTQLAAAGLDEHVDWDDLDLWPWRRGIALEGVSIGDGAGRELVAVGRASCADVALDRGWITSLRCAAEDAEVDLDGITSAAGVPSPVTLGRQTLRADSGWALDDGARTFEADGSMAIPSVARSGCDLALDGIDLTTWIALHEAAEPLRRLDPLADPIGYGSAAQQVAGTLAGIAGDLQVRRAGCELRDEGLAAAIAGAGVSAQAMAMSTSVALSLLDPTLGDAVGRLLTDGGTVRVGTPGPSATPIFQALAATTPTSVLSLPARVAGVRVTYTPPER